MAGNLFGAARIGHEVAEQSPVARAGAVRIAEVEANFRVPSEGVGRDVEDRRRLLTGDPVRVAGTAPRMFIRPSAARASAFSPTSGDGVIV